MLIDLEVLEVIESLPRREQEKLWRRFRQIGQSPRRFSEFTAADEIGRLLDVNVCGRFASAYWDDEADKHVKILRLSLADR